MRLTFFDDCLHPRCLLGAPRPIQSSFRLRLGNGMKVVKVTRDEVILCCVDCGQGISVTRKSIRPGTSYAPECPNEACISHWCPRIIDELPALGFPSLTDAWRHAGDVVTLVAALCAFLVFMLLGSASLGFVGFLSVAIFFVHRYQFRVAIRWETALVRCSVLLVAAAYLSKIAAAWGIVMMLGALLMRQLSPNDEDSNSVSEGNA
jgi:hypothetical protein